MKFDVLDYLGKYRSGIVSLLSLNYDNEYYEAIFFYTNELVVITPDDKLEDKLGCQIEDWNGYNNLMVDIISKVVPYDELINSIDEIDFEKYSITQ